MLRRERAFPWADIGTKWILSVPIGERDAFACITVRMRGSTKDVWALQDEPVASLFKPFYFYKFNLILIRL